MPNHKILHKSDNLPITKQYHKNEMFIYFDYTDITMLEVEAKVRKWGRSFGVVIPKDKIMKEGIKENDTINLLIGKKSNVLRETFGTMKFKKSTQEMLDESDREDWDG